MSSAPHSPLAKAARWFQQHAVLLFIMAWTVFAALVLYWLLGGNPGPSVWVVRGEDPLQPGLTKSFQVRFITGMDFPRIYPWILLGPYVALVSAHFPFERGRIRLSLAMNLAACAIFIIASHAINTRARLKFANVVLIKSSTLTGKQETRQAQIRTATTNSPNLLGQSTAPYPAWEESIERFSLDAKSGSTSDIPNPKMVDWPVQLPPDIRSAMPVPRPPPLGLGSLLLDLLAYGAVVGVAHAVHFYRRFRERERRALSLESSLAQARLNMLRAQLQPHFLFNSLNAIATLLRRDPQLAEATLMSLSELLRLSLSQSEKTEAALRDEIEFVQRYLEIQQTRFGDKLRVEMDIEPAALEGQVPALLLQPLVENAIRHGIEPAEHSGLVRLAAHRRNEKLVLTVEDNGVGLAGPAILSNGPIAVRHPTMTNLSPVTTVTSKTNGRTGIGLANLRARLQMLYSGNQRLELIPRHEGGLMVRIEIPWRPLTEITTSGSITFP